MTRVVVGVGERRMHRTVEVLGRWRRSRKEEEEVIGNMLVWSMNLWREKTRKTRAKKTKKRAERRLHGE